MTPEKIDRYKIEGEIGRGGMATVFKAYDPRFERHVAVKVLPREFMHDPEFRARFNREAKTIASLEHPAIVPVYDYGEDDGLLYLVMRLMPGGSLADRLEKGPIPIEESAEILQRLGAALDRAHSQGIIHRDLKPSNVLFDQYGDAFLADFGIVRVTGSDSNLTASGSLVGTPTYMSPEQVYGDKELDGRSDIYALGIILFQMLTGRLPYEADTPAKLMMKHILDPVPGLLTERPDLSPETEAVVSKALAKKRDDRYETGADFSAALSTATREIPVSDDLQKQLSAMQMAAVQVTPAPTGNEPVVAAPESVVAAPLVVAEPEPEPSGAVDDVPAALENEVLTEMGLSGATEGKKEGGDAAPTSAKNNHLTAWLVVAAVAVVACLGMCGLGAIGLSQMNKIGVFTEMGTAVVTDLPTAMATTTPAAFPLINEDDRATATRKAEVSAAATREEIAFAATLAAEDNEVEPPTSDTISPAEATRSSLLATRNAAAEATPAGTTDLAATRAALLIERGAAFPVTAVFGPENGELQHSADSGIELAYTSVNLSNFIAQVSVVNPYAASENSWDFGLLFRQETADEELRLVVESDGRWSLNDRSADADNLLQKGSVTDSLNRGAGESNEIILTAYGEKGLFFLNGKLVAVLDLSTRDDFGEVALGTGFYTSNKQEGATTTYKNFTVWPYVAQFGPEAGELAHGEDGFIRMSGAGVTLRNFIAEAEFFNPYDETIGSWDWGFAFREQEQEYWLAIESDGGWTLVERRPDEDVYVAEGTVGDALLTGLGEANDLSLVALNGRGYFFLNGEMVSELDLSQRLDAGDVSVFASFFLGDEVPGYVTAYDGFTVWPLP